MPSRDSTGKALSGAASRAKAAAREQLRAQLETAAPALAQLLPKSRTPRDQQPPHPLTIPPLPRASVEAAIAWASLVQAQAAALARSGEDLDRVRAVASVVQSMAKLRVAAQDSERALQVLEAYQRKKLELGAEPPAEPAAVSAWAFWQLAELLHHTATTPDPVDGPHVALVARSCALAGSVQASGELARIGQQARRKPARRKPG